MISNTIEADVLFSFTGNYIMVNNSTTYDDILKQSKANLCAEYNMTSQSIFNNFINEQSIKNANVFLEELKKFVKTDKYVVAKMNDTIPLNFKSWVFNKLYEEYKLENLKYSGCNRSFSTNKVKIKDRKV